MSRTVLVRGTGDVGSAVAHALIEAGHRVAMHDLPAPPHGRRGMAFVDAIFESFAQLEGVIAKRAHHTQAIPRMLVCRKAIAVSVEEFAAVLQAVRPNVLVDARMRKRAIPEPQTGLAPLTIGLGPNFVAGETTDLAVETGQHCRAAPAIQRAAGDATTPAAHKTVRASMRWPLTSTP